MGREPGIENGLIVYPQKNNETESRCFFWLSWSYDSNKKKLNFDSWNSTENVLILQPQKLSITNYVLHDNGRSTEFEALMLWNVRSGDDSCNPHGHDTKIKQEWFVFKKLSSGNVVNMVIWRFRIVETILFVLDKKNVWFFFLGIGSASSDLQVVLTHVNPAIQDAEITKEHQNISLTIYSFDYFIVKPLETISFCPYFAYP